MKEENFGNQPFLTLKKSVFPGKTEDEEAERDKQLFLNEYEKLKNPQKPVAKSGFTIGEYLHWPMPKKISPRKAKEKKVPPSPVKPEPAKKPDDGDIFLRAMAGASPLGGKGREIKPRVKLNAAVTEPGFDKLLETNLEFALMYSDEYLEGRVAEMDDSMMERLRQGQLSPEAHLDLHGLNVMQAYEALREFLRSAWYKGMRVALLVPGRGLNSPNGRSILRQKLQTWLTQEPFKRVVLAFCTAIPRDGGPGSIYVLLRKYRKKGRIYWDRLPADVDLYD